MLVYLNVFSTAPTTSSHFHSQLTLYPERIQLFSPGSIGIHSTWLRKIVNIYRFALKFWAVKADIEREGWLLIRPSSIPVRFQSYINTIEDKIYGHGEKFSKCGIK